MKYVNSLIRLLLVITLLYSCKNSSTSLNNGQNCSIKVEDLEKKLLGKRLDSADSFSNCFQVKDTTFEADAVWKGKKFIRNKDLSFTVEASWIDSVFISRITVESSFIKTLDGVAVGSKLEDIIPQMSSNIPVLPDGYFALKDIKDDNIFYYFDTDKYPNVAEGRIGKISDLPKQMKISSIVLQKHK